MKQWKTETKKQQQQKNEKKELTSIGIDGCYSRRIRFVKFSSFEIELK